jgi:hypothetical protein
MAFHQLATAPQGFDARDAYHRVEQISITAKNRMTFRLRIYKDVSFPAFADTDYSCDYDLDGFNPIKQAYLYLKSLPEFADAVDC